MEYRDVTLFALGLLGVILHCLVEIKKLKANDKNFSLSAYMSTEWVTIAISVIVVVISIVCKHEVTALDGAGNWLGLGFVALGYMGQSILIAFMSKAQSKLGIEDNETTTV